MIRLTDAITLKYSDMANSKIGWRLRRSANGWTVATAMAAFCLSGLLLYGSVLYLSVAVNPAWACLGIIPGWLTVTVLRALARGSIAGAKKDWDAAWFSSVPVSYWTCDDGITETREGMSILYRYSHMEFAAESHELFSFCCANQTVVIPKRALSDLQTQAIRKLLQQRIHEFVVIPKGHKHTFVVPLVE